MFVVAATDDAIHLPPDEVRFYLLIFALALVLLMIAGATIMIEHRNLVERASFDPLTELPNRSEFERRTADIIASAERKGSAFCLLLFDLNGFKPVNDTYGHNAGDEMLKVVGNRLRKAVRDGDVVARWGGDEFVVVMPGIGDDEMGARRAEQLAEQVAGRTRLEGVGEALRVQGQRRRRHLAAPRRRARARSSRPPTRRCTRPSARGPRTTSPTSRDADSPSRRSGA